MEPRSLTNKLLGKCQPTSCFIFQSLNADDEVFFLIQLTLKKRIPFNRLKLPVTFTYVVQELLQRKHTQKNANKAF